MKICMILEGCYPYVHGGVSSWMHQYIQAMPQNEFVLWCIGADSKDKDRFKYELPHNVVEVNQIFLNDALKLDFSKTKKFSIDEYQKAELKKFLQCKKFDWNVIFDMVVNEDITPADILQSEVFVDLIKEICKNDKKNFSFLNYFHTMRSMLLPLLYIMWKRIPKADIYHATCTGYSGVLGSLANWRYNRPFIVTEHGIYTREREEELLQATWVLPEFRQMWVDFFYMCSKCAYDRAIIVTALFKKANYTQNEIGCDYNKTRVIANGVHYNRFVTIPDKKPNGYVDIGAVIRIAKIKDVKTMLYAFMELKSWFSNARLHIMGDVDDEEYFDECKLIIEQNDIEDVIFTGMVNIIEYMEKIDFTILTSISEGQPLSVLESFAAKRPAVVTDVGCCRELIYGTSDDNYGRAGMCVPPMHREKLASALLFMCQNEKERNNMGIVGQKRVEKYYTHETSMKKYVDMYEEVIGKWYK